MSAHALGSSLAGSLLVGWGLVVVAVLGCSRAEPEPPTEVAARRVESTAFVDGVHKDASESMRAFEQEPRPEAESPSAAEGSEQVQPSAEVVTGQGFAAAPLEAPSERAVVCNAELMLTDESVQATADEVVALVAEAAGYVDSREQRHVDSKVTEVRLVLRVPAKRFDQVLARVKETGRVLQERVEAQDVTLEVADVKARLRAQRQLEERLLALLGNSDKIKDLLEVERELARVRSELERLVGRETAFANLTAYGTLTASIVSEEQPAVAASEGVSSRFKNAGRDATEASIVVLTTLIRVAGALLPLLPLPVFLYLALQWRRRRRHMGLQA